MMEPITIDIKALNLIALLPVIILSLGALVIICLDLIKKDLSKNFYIVFSTLCFLLAFVATLGYEGEPRAFFGIINFDGIARLATLLVTAFSAIFLLFSASRQDFHETKMAEFYALYLFMNAGFMCMTLTNNLVLIFVGLETGSLALYALIAMHNRLKSIEAALKYFTLGALASGFFAFSGFLFYALSGSLEVNEITQALIKRGPETLYGVLAAAIFLLASLGFKLSLVPFHTWTPDVYEGSSSQMAGYMSIVPKIATFIVVLRVFEGLIKIDIAWVSVVLYLVVIVTISLANVMALIQKDVKRMLAFSSISHAGFLLAAIFINTDLSNEAFFAYWVLFGVANIGAFGVLWMSRSKQPVWDKRYEHPYEKFSGLIKTSPALAITMGIFMISLAGIPPFSLFWGKLFLVNAAVSEGYMTLAVILMVNSAIALYYYLKVIVFMFLKEPIAKDKNPYFINATATLKVLIGAVCALCIISALFVEPLLETIRFYIG